MSARNAQFARRALNGEQLVDLAREYGISNTRAAELVRHWCRRQNAFEYYALVYAGRNEPTFNPTLRRPLLAELRANAHQFTS